MPAEELPLASTPSGRKQIESIRAYIRNPGKGRIIVSVVRINGAVSRRSTMTNNRRAALAFNLEHAKSMLNGTLPPGLPVKDDAAPVAEQPMLFQ